MSNKSTLVTLFVVGIIAAVSLPALFARDESPSNWSALERAYAAANLELAQSRLALAETQKQAVADSVSQDTIDALQANVRYLQARATQLSGGKAPDPFTTLIAAAQHELKAVEADH